MPCHAEGYLQNYDDYDDDMMMMFSFDEVAHFVTSVLCPSVPYAAAQVHWTPLQLLLSHFVLSLRVRIQVEEGVNTLPSQS